MLTYFSDLTKEEFFHLKTGKSYKSEMKKLQMGLVPQLTRGKKYDASLQRVGDYNYIPRGEEKSIKRRVDLSDTISRPRSQGISGSCYAFSISHLVENAVSGRVTVSPQHFINCAHSLDQNSWGIGGESLPVLLYVLDNYGYKLESEVPYAFKGLK